MSMKSMSDRQLWAVGRLGHLFRNSNHLLAPSAQRDADGMRFLTALGMTEEEIEPVLRHMDEVAIAASMDSHYRRMVEDGLTPTVEPYKSAPNALSRRSPGCPRLSLV